MNKLRHMWRDGKISGFWHVQRCRNCHMRRRELTGHSGATKFEYSADGKTWAESRNVPPCEAKEAGNG